MCFKVASVLAFSLGAILYAIPASATTCTVPTTFSAGTPAIAAQVNSNFSSLQTCGNNIDNTNIGTAGIFATQIKPTNSGQATFGGGQIYTFPTQITVGGTVVANPGYGSGFVSTAFDGQGQLIFNSNNGANQTLIGENTGSGFPAFAIAKLSAGSAFQAWLLGMDESGNTMIAGNVTSTGLTVNGAIQNNGSFSSTGNVAASGVVSATGNVTSGAQINSSGTMTNTGLTVNGNAGVSGTLAAGSDFTGSAAIYKNVGGTRFGVPFNANETSGSVNNHYEHGAVNDTNGALASNVCDGPFNITFAKVYDAIPTVVVSANSSAGSPLMLTSVKNITVNGFSITVCNASTSGAAQPTYLDWLALGE